MAVEDSLSEVILRALISQSGRLYAVGFCYSRGGYGYLKDKINGFNNAAKGGTPFFVLTDLDKTACPPELIRQWLSPPHKKHPNLIFRIAVHEVESWVLAHHDAFAKFLGIKMDLIPEKVDEIPDPKKFLIDLAKKSSQADLRNAIVPPSGSSRAQGPDYNGKLSLFVRESWCAASASKRSPSLARALKTIKEFKPHAA